MGPVICLGTPWRFAQSPTILQVETLVLRVGVDVVTVDESVIADEEDCAACSVANTAGYVAFVTGDENVAADERGYTAGEVGNAADYVAVTTVDESVAAGEGTTLLMAWQMLLILLLLHRELGLVL